MSRYEQSSSVKVRYESKRRKWVKSRSVTHILPRWKLNQMTCRLQTDAMQKKAEIEQHVKRYEQARVKLSKSPSSLHPDVSA